MRHTAGPFGPAKGQGSGRLPGRRSIQAETQRRHRQTAVGRAFQAEETCVQRLGNQRKLYGSEEFESYATALSNHPS